MKYLYILTGSAVISGSMYAFSYSAMGAINKRECHYCHVKFKPRVVTMSYATATIVQVLLLALVLNGDRVVKWSMTKQTRLPSSAL